MYRIIALFLLIVTSKYSFAQTKPLEIIKIHKTKTSYRTYEVAGDRLFAITDSGQLIIWDLAKYDTIRFAKHNPLTRYTAIGKDRKGNIFLGTEQGHIYKIDAADLGYSEHLKIKYPIKYICFNSKNKMFLMVPYGIYDPISKKAWTRFKTVTGGISGIKRTGSTRHLSIPHFVFFDHEDRWWLCSNHGEFGSEIKIFDAKREKAYDEKIDSLQTGSLFPKSVFNDSKGNTYLTSGLQHMMNFGEIYKIASGNVASKIFDAKNLSEKDVELVENNGLFVGPGAYNLIDGNVYFATQKGIYKAELPEEGILKNFVPLFNPELTWSREPLAIGAKMSYVSLRFIEDGKLIIQTANDGIVIYNGRNLIFLK
ncbi:MAG: hypothetical protein V4594_11275 [Bacteroidota bacterium]